MNNEYPYKILNSWFTLIPPSGNLTIGFRQIFSMLGQRLFLSLAWRWHVRLPAL
jgi:hypothetical protein